MIKKTHFSLIISFLFLFFSCKGQESESFKTEVYIFHDCSINFSKSKIDEIKQRIQSKVKIYEPNLKPSNLMVSGILNSFNKSLKTNAFNKVCKINQIRFLLGKHNYNNFYTDQFNIQEWFVKNKEDATLIYKYLNEIPNKKIYYKPPQNWKWLKDENRIYFIYSETYKSNSEEFKNIFDIVKKTVFNEE